MTYSQGPQYLPKHGNSMNSRWRPDAVNPDPALIEAIAQALAEQQMRAQVGAQDPGQYFMQGRSPEPNALTGGVVEPFSGFMDAQGAARSPAGTPGAAETWDRYLREAGGQGHGPYSQPDLVDDSYADSMVGLTQEEPAAKPKAKKGEFSDFFKVLKAAKSGDKDIKKGFKDLAKQLNTGEQAGNAETTIATS